MSRRSLPPTDWWVRLGKVFPKEVRERVYEPAVTDLRLDRFESENRTEAVPFGLLALLTLLGCMPVALRWSLLHPEAVSRRTRVVLASAVLLVGLVMVVQYFTTGETGY